MRYFIHLNYNGANYCGWQIQPEQDTVQARLTDAVSKITSHAVQITGCGRTDTGVHARSYYAHFDTETELPATAVLRLNKMLPPDIGIRGIFPVADNAHARFDAVEREYRYFIHSVKDAFLQDRSYWLHSYDLDFAGMNRAAALLTGFSDFSVFEKAGGGNNTSICDVRQALWERDGAGRWFFRIHADRFLRNMVRRITGTLLTVGTGRLTPEEMAEAVEGKRPLKVNFAPPAHGLFLWEVRYPEEYEMN